MTSAINKIPGLRKVISVIEQHLGKNGFHGDQIMKILILNLIKTFSVKTFIETGTYHGDTTTFVAKNIKNLIIYSSEINPDYYQFNRRNLKKFSNIKIINKSSDIFLSDIYHNENVVAPLFYLDAHWYDYWPLEDELKIITSNLQKAIIVIDDFQVPGRSDFIYCRGGGGSAEFSDRKTVDERECNLGFITPFLKKSNKYRFIFPSYQIRDAKVSRLIGYVTIFQNYSSDEVRIFMETDFIKKHFLEFGGGSDQLRNEF